MIWLTEEELNGISLKPSSKKKPNFTLRFRYDTGKTGQPFCNLSLSRGILNVAKERKFTAFTVGVDPEKKEVYVKLVTPKKSLSAISLLNSKGGYRSLVGATTLIQALNEKTNNAISTNEKLSFESVEKDPSLFVYKYDTPLLTDEVTNDSTQE